MVVREYVCCSKGHGIRAICCVSATVFFFYESLGKKGIKGNI